MCTMHEYKTKLRQLRAFTQYSVDCKLRPNQAKEETQRDLEGNYITLHQTI